MMSDPVLAFKRFPVRAALNETIRDSFGRRFIPGTTRLYQRAKTGCVHDGIHNDPGHCACDLAKGMAGKQVVSVWDGTVRLKSFGSAFGGHQITIVRSGTTQGVFYAHLDRFYKGIHEGQKVSAGHVLGYVGNEGQTSGAHLHFEVRLDWRNWCTARSPYRRLIQAQTRER
jgi:murein DD-endopeptidase MepM/ murein hydrolase activator NlpD